MENWITEYKGNIIVEDENTHSFYTSDPITGKERIFDTLERAKNYLDRPEYYHQLVKALHD